MSKVTIDFVGDGASSIATIDLGAPPFNFPWSGRFPKTEVMGRVIDGETPDSSAIDSFGVLTVTFANPLVPPNPGTLSPRTKIEFWLLY
jgi:hypothetical protein